MFGTLGIWEILGILIVGAGMFVYLTKDLGKYKKMDINNVDLVYIEYCLRCYLFKIIC